MVKLDLGCGKNKKEGFIGVDQYPIPGVDVVMDLVNDPWPWEDSSVDEIHCSHFIEHLGAKDRIKFVNNLWRVLKPGCSASLVAPHWASNRAYGDMTHMWPPVSEMWFYYLSKQWRKDQVPHDDIEFNPDGYSCDFECTWGYALHPSIVTRNTEYQQHATQFWLESRQDIHANLKALK